MRRQRDCLERLRWIWWLGLLSLVGRYWRMVRIHVGVEEEREKEAEKVGEVRAFWGKRNTERIHDGEATRKPHGGDSGQRRRDDTPARSSEGKGDEEMGRRRLELGEEVEGAAAPADGIRRAAAGTRSRRQNALLLH